MASTVSEIVNGRDEVVGYMTLKYDEKAKQQLIGWEIVKGSARGLASLQGSQAEQCGMDSVRPLSIHRSKL